jgi:hypothetical protein
MYSIVCLSLSYDTRYVFSLFSVKYMGSCPLNKKKPYSSLNTISVQFYISTSWWFFFLPIKGCHWNILCLTNKEENQRYCPLRWIRLKLGSFERSFTHWTVPLKVVGNEKGGGSKAWLQFEDAFGPWRSMSVYFLMLPSSFPQRISVSCL